jgi:hypothetical protein
MDKQSTGCFANVFEPPVMASLDNSRNSSSLEDECHA